MFIVIFYCVLALAVAVGLATVFDEHRRAQERLTQSKLDLISELNRLKHEKHELHVYDAKRMDRRVIGPEEC